MGVLDCDGAFRLRWSFGRGMEKTEFWLPVGECSHKIQMSIRYWTRERCKVTLLLLRKSFLASTLDELSSLRSHRYDLPQNTFLANTDVERWNFLGDPCIRPTAISNVQLLLTLHLRVPIFPIQSLRSVGSKVFHQCGLSHIHDIGPCVCNNQVVM